MFSNTPFSLRTRGNPIEHNPAVASGSTQPPPPTDLTAEQQSQTTRKETRKDKMPSWLGLSHSKAVPKGPSDFTYAMQLDSFCRENDIKGTEVTTLTNEINALFSLHRKAEKFKLANCPKPLIDLDKPAQGKVDIHTELMTLLEDIKYENDKKIKVSKGWDKRYEFINEKKYERHLDAPRTNRLHNALTHFNNQKASLEEERKALLEEEKKASTEDRQKALEKRQKALEVREKELLEERRTFIVLFTGGAPGVDGQCGADAKSRIDSAFFNMQWKIDSEAADLKALLKVAVADYMAMAFDAHFLPLTSQGEMAAPYMRKKTEFFEKGAVDTTELGGSTLHFDAEKCLQHVAGKLEEYWKKSDWAKVQIGGHKDPSKMEEAGKVFYDGSPMYKHFAYNMKTPLLIDQAHILELLQENGILEQHSQTNTHGLPTPAYQTKKLLADLYADTSGDLSDLTNLLLKKLETLLVEARDPDQIAAYLQLLPEAYRYRLDHIMKAAEEKGNPALQAFFSSADYINNHLLQSTSTGEIKTWAKAIQHDPAQIADFLLAKVRSGNVESLAPIVSALLEEVGRSSKSKQSLLQRNLFHHDEGKTHVGNLRNLFKGKSTDETLLHSALKTLDLGTINAVLSLKRSWGANQQGETPLHTAFSLCMESAVQSSIRNMSAMSPLFSMGRNVEAPQRRATLSLIAELPVEELNRPNAAGKTALRQAIELKEPALCNALVERGVSTAAIVNDQSLWLEARSREESSYGSDIWLLEFLRSLQANN